MIGYTETLKGISEGEQTDKKLSNKYIENQNSMIYHKNKFLELVRFQNKQGEQKYMNLKGCLV